MNVRSRRQAWLALSLCVLLAFPAMAARADGDESAAETTDAPEISQDAPEDTQDEQQQSVDAGLLEIQLALEDGEELDLTDESGAPAGILTGTQDGLTYKRGEEEETAAVISVSVRIPQSDSEQYLKQIGVPPTWWMKIELQFGEETVVCWAAADRVKDSAYVLSALGQAAVSTYLLPAGEATKEQQPAESSAEEIAFPNNDAGASTDIQSASQKEWISEPLQDVISWMLIALLAAALFLILFALKKIGRYSAERNMHFKKKNEFDADTARTEPIWRIERSIQQVAAATEQISPEIAGLKKHFRRIADGSDQGETAAAPVILPRWTDLADYANAHVHMERFDPWLEAFRNKRFEPQSIQPALNMTGYYETSAFNRSCYLAAFRDAPEGKEMLYVIPSCNDSHLRDREVREMFDMEEGDVDTSGYYKIKRPTILTAENSKYYKVQQKGLLIIRKKS